MGNLTKLSVHIVLDQSTLDHCNQIARIIRNDESNWTMPPSALALEISKPLSVLLVGGVKGSPWTPYKV